MAPLPENEKAPFALVANCLARVWSKRPSHPVMGEQAEKTATQNKLFLATIIQKCSLFLRLIR